MKKSGYMTITQKITDMSDKMSIVQILELLYNKKMEPSEAKELLSNLVDDELTDDECKCIRFTGSDKWYPNGCKIHPNG